MSSVDDYIARVERESVLDGFDVELVGFDCSDALLDEWMENPKAFRWRCPFNPGCGAQSLSQCAEKNWKQKRALIASASKSQQ